MLVNVTRARICELLYTHRFFIMQLILSKVDYFYSNKDSPSYEAEGNKNT